MSVYESGAIPEGTGCWLILLTFICLDNYRPLEGKRGWRKAQGCQGNIRSSEAVYNLPGVYLLPTGIEARTQEGSNEIHIYHRQKVVTVGAIWDGSLLSHSVLRTKLLWH